MTEPRVNEVILEGTLNHVMESRAAQRWVVLEKNKESGHVYLSIYRKAPPVKSDLKKRYELTDSNFIGTERGTIKTHAKRSMLYWAIILQQESIIFNDKEALDKSTSDFEKWNDVVKKLWNHQSWEVSPLQGSAIDNYSKLVLHLSTASLCLALLSPPRHLLRWPLSNISDCDCHDCVFSFNVIGNDLPGYYEVKVTRSRHASKIKMVCNELRQVNNSENKEPPIPSIRQFTTVSVEDRIPSAEATVALPLRNSNISISSTTSLNPERKDTGSIASFDSAMSTPSPVPQKGEHTLMSKNPFVFPPDGGLGESLGDASFIPDPAISPAIPQTLPKPVAKPRTPSPSSHYSVVRVDPHSHTSSVDSCAISTCPHPRRPSSPTAPDQMMKDTSSTSTQERNSTSWCRFPMRPTDDNVSEARDFKLKCTASNEAMYMNTYDNSERVNPDTEPLESNQYMNFDEHSPYENPIIKKHERDNVGPKVAPKPQPPNPPPRKRDLPDLIHQVRMGKKLIKDFIPSYKAWQKFCLHFDIKKDTYPLKDWRALAERLGLKISDIDLVEHTSTQNLQYTATEIVLAYWQSNAPDDMPFTVDQLVKELRMMERHDLVTIFDQGEEYT